MDHRPIADYALLSDCRSAALVSSQGSIDWLCFPDFDSPSVFGRLLDAQAGHWSICTQETVKASRRYVEDAMVLQTTFESEHGTAVLTDAMASWAARARTRSGPGRAALFTAFHRVHRLHGEN